MPPSPRTLLLAMLAISFGVVQGFVPPVLWPRGVGALHGATWHVRRCSSRRLELSVRAQSDDECASKAHDSWALLLRHHANVAWHGVQSEYRLENPVVLRTHHGRPGKRVRVLDADRHGTVVSTLRPVRRAGEGDSGADGAAEWGGCTWEEQEKYQLRHARSEDSPNVVVDLPPPTNAVHGMPGADAGAVVCVEESFCRSWLSPSVFGGPRLSIEFAFRFGDWRARTEIRYHRGSLVSAVCTWEKVGTFPSHLSDTTYKDVESRGPEGQDIVFYNDWHGVSFGRVDNDGARQVAHYEPRLAVWTGFCDTPDALVLARKKGSGATHAGAEAEGTQGAGNPYMHAVKGEELFLLPQGAWIRCPQQVDIVKIADRRVGAAGDGPAASSGGGGEKWGPAGEDVVISAGWVLWDEERIEDSLLARLTAAVTANDIAVLTQDGRKECMDRETRPIRRLALEKFWYREQPDYGVWFDKYEYAKRAEEAEMLAIQRRLTDMSTQVCIPKEPCE